MLDELEFEDPEFDEPERLLLDEELDPERPLLDDDPEPDRLLLEPLRDVEPLLERPAPRFEPGPEPPGEFFDEVERPLDDPPKLLDEPVRPVDEFDDELNERPLTELLLLLLLGIVLKIKVVDALSLTLPY